MLNRKHLIQNVMKAAHNIIFKGSMIWKIPAGYNQFLDFEPVKIHCG